MNVVEIEVEKLIPYANNPRNNAEAVDYVAASIREFGFKQPVVVDKDLTIAAGHTRVLAAKKLGLETVPCVVADDLTPAQIKAFRLADNKVAEIATWDFEKLELELADLPEINMTEFGFDSISEDDDRMDKYDIPADEKGSLVEQFVVPPFSVLDTRQGYWQERKKYWLEKTGDLSETRDGEFGKISEGMIEVINGGTSNFDPVLAECVYKWFTPDKNIKILDPFGGEQTKGVVAGELGLDYVGMEIRQEQVDLNRRKTASYSGVKYYCGDSNEISKTITDRDFNLCFTSPPYYDLEVYSKEDMSALGSYEEFMQFYGNIFRQCYEMLEEGSFCVVKVGEIRDKKTGAYRCFVADNIKLLTEIGFTFYDDIVLINAVGTAQLRAAQGMKTRKIVKLHQNVLVFYKGNLKDMKKRFSPIEFSDIERKE